MTATLVLPRGAGAKTTRRRRRSRREWRPTRWGRILAVSFALLLATALGGLALSQAAPAAVSAELSRAHASAEVKAFYDARGNRPVWTSGFGPLPGSSLTAEGRQMAALAQQALPGEISDAARRELATAMAAVDRGEVGAVARAEVALTRALADYVTTMQVAPNGARLAFTDPDFGRPGGVVEALEQVAQAESLEGKLAELKTVNPVYRDLRAAYEAQRKAGPPANQALILANLKRARLLPAPIGERFILVNPAAGQLWLYEHGKPVDSMKVVVGKPDEQTPMMAGLMRYAVFNPYWDIPVDLVQSGIAPKVLNGGVSAFKAQHLQALSGWDEDAVEVDPATVDWKALAAHKAELRVRQLPGGDNMMGQVKFMLPNELGIYLHDTPNRGAFNQEQRLLSAGCVRVERARDLAKWLLQGDMADAASLGPDTRVDLKSNVPVYISYLTAQAGPDGKIQTYPDVYGRDRR